MTYSLLTVGIDPSLKQFIKNELIELKKSLLQENSLYDAFKTPFDKKAQENVYEVARSLLLLKPTMVVLVGIGGSSMGTMAIMQALFGSYYNDGCPLISFYGADTIDNDQQIQLLHRAERELAQGGSVIVCIVSKSGATSETLINASFFIELLKKYKMQDYNRYVAVVSDEHSPLHAIAVSQGYTYVSMPTMVGGRFSLFTASTLLPLALLGIDSRSLCAGATDILNKTITEEEESDAAYSALTLFSHYTRGYGVHSLFVFSPDLLMLGNWYKQLIGESLGKKYTLQDEYQENGITPVVSVGTIDLHSVVQLYLAGPHTTFTTFIMPSDEEATLVVPANDFTKNSDFVGKSVTSIKRAIFKSVVDAYKEEERPYLLYSLAKKDSYSLGSFMMMKMIETVLLGRLMNINPFDQPAVELYKKNIKKYII